MLNAATGTVCEVLEDLNDIQRVAVRLNDGAQSRCICYPTLSGRVAAGDRVLVNTTATDLKLGSGGWDFVVARLAGAESESHAPGPGHVMKLRYTPLQHAVLACEEEASPHHAALAEAQSLGGMPVVAGQLHSQLAPIAIGLAFGARQLGLPPPRVAYLMTDSGALPMALSGAVRGLRSAGLIADTITVGQAFGGDIEAVNVYSGLLAARYAVGADVAIVCQGPGNVGTGTPMGFGGMDMAVAINAAAAIGGTPIAAARVSFADPRPRHQGISHHTVTALCTGALASALVPLPAELIDDSRLSQELAAIASAHTVRPVDCPALLDELRASPVPLSSMGRRLQDDPWFFVTAACAGVAAGQELAQARPPDREA